MSGINNVNIQQNLPITGQGMSTGRQSSAPAISHDSIEISSGKEPEKDWTILIYMNDNNNLSSQGKAKLNNQLKEIDKSDKLNLAVHFSALRSKGWTHPNAINSTRYEVRKNGLTKLEELGPLNMASPDTLTDFISWGMEKYPAKHYMVVMQGHGGAWHGGLPDDVYNDRMDLPKIDKAFEETEKRTGKKPDIIAFDACLMGNVEAAWQMRNHAGIMIGSEEVEMGMESEYAEDVSVPYKEIFSNLSEKIDSGAEVGPEALAKDWVQACDGKWTTPTQSAINLGKMDGMAKSLDSLANSILDGKTPISVIRDIADNTKNMRHEKIDRWYQNDDYKMHLLDLHEFADKISTDPRITDETTKKAAIEILQQFDDVVIASEAGNDFSVETPIKYSPSVHISDSYEGDRNHGISIFAPTNPHIMKYLETSEKYPTKYREISFTKDTAWGRLAEKLAGEEVGNG